MSNAANIDSLKELISTSPLQDESEGHGERNIELDLSKAEVLKYGEEDQNTEADDQVRRVETLLNQQSQKLQRIQERNELLKRRSKLLEEIENSEKQIHGKRRESSMRDQNKQLDALLIENSKLHTEAEYDYPEASNSSDDGHMLKDIHVLPSSNISARLKQAKRFFNDISIENIRSSTIYDEKSDIFKRTISYSVSTVFFRLPIAIVIDSRSDKVLQIDIPELSDKDGIIMNLMLLSKQYVDILLKNYIPKKKIDLIMFSLGSLTTCLKQRCHEICKVFEVFGSFIKNKKVKTNISKEANDHLITDISMRSKNSVTLLVPSKSSNEAYFKLDLIWEICVTDNILGVCGNELRLYITKEVNGVRQYDIKNGNSLFIGLVQEYGVIRSLKILFKSVFEIEV
ncbi:Piso0_000328 [Millerozyma farinosa CBS 7064]|uniref:Piso0_000328 protein n=1 Tax=Pichia sorbitophila (strain ATCC MYA-4447 / BCRC 22081 / CBS 7064 / NBRC 10061 / NRRL Y-12695) TaxID=559304 RepID=G8YV51_PICSO|nr:Piso0_000328 [Millerozyma farinosa CBS 7064]CCE73295.1 Piso0_000328 [Millerozyma farinosa CBS 7064]